MRTLLIVAAAALSSSGFAIGGETRSTLLMTDEQMDQVVAGAGPTLKVHGNGNNGNGTVSLGIPEAVADNVPAPNVGFRSGSGNAAKPLP